MLPGRCLAAVWLNNNSSLTFKSRLIFEYGAAFALLKRSLKPFCFMPERAVQQIFNIKPDCS